tara:strand:- start:1595 stop:2329 length:735 start_codon:yes stop_codon:yes gene_type:complete
MPKIPGASKTAKTVVKRGRKRKARGRKVIPEHIKNKAKAAGYSSVKKWKEAGSPEPKKKSKKKTKKSEKRTKAERSEIARLAREQRRDRDAQTRSERDTTAPVRSSVPSGGRRLSVRAPERSSVAGQSVEAGPLRSKVPPPGTTRADRVSPARRRQLATSGMAGVGPTGLMTNKGTFAPPARQTAEAMGIGNKGVLPSKEELQAMGGFEIKKHGGKVGKKTKRKSSRGVGTGVALRGYGAVRNK